MTMDDTLHIAVACNGRYIPGALVALAGVAANARRDTPLAFHVFTEGVEDDALDCMRDVLARLHPRSEVVHHPCGENQLDGLPEWAGSRLASVRCVFPRLLKDVDWCLYLDCDILYLASVEEHFALRDEDALACVVQEEHPDTRHSEIEWLRREAGVEIPDGKYFNSGVVLLNLAKMREENTGEKLVAFFKEHGEIPLPDQDALNAVFGGNVKMLPPKFNRLQICITDGKLRERPVIHYVCGNPWTHNLGCVANNRFRLWHKCADRWIWGRDGESARRCFPWRLRAGKVACHLLLRTPILSRAFAWALQRMNLIRSARDWRRNQTGCDISRRAMKEIFE